MEPNLDELRAKVVEARNDLMRAQDQSKSAKDLVRIKQENLEAAKRAVENYHLVPHVSDHALLRIFQRKYKINFDEIRSGILTPNVMAAIRAGASAVVVDGYRYAVKGNCIATVLEKEMIVSQKHLEKFNGQSP